MFRNGNIAELIMNVGLMGEDLDVHLIPSLLDDRPVNIGEPFVIFDCFKISDSISNIFFDESFNQLSI